MGVFTQLGATELTDVVAAFELGALRGFEPIAAGTINSNYRVDTDRGRWFVRVNEGKAELDVAWEARLVGALAAAGVATPGPVVARDGRPYAPLVGKWVSVFPWRAGHHLAAEALTPALVGELGASLARLHVAGLALPIAWRRASIYDHDHLCARYAAIAKVDDPALTHALAVIGDELAIASDAAALRGQATAGLIHGDLFRDNVLWDADRVVAILDFEQASGGSLAYDLGVVVNDWAWRGGPELSLARALLDGYQRVRPLSAEDRAALPIEVRAAAARFTLTRITDVYLARVANPDKDFRAFLARSEAWRGPVLGQISTLL